MVRIIRKKSLQQRLKENLSNFKLFAFMGVMTLVVGLTFYLTTQQQDLRQRASGTEMPSWGKIANTGHTGESTKGIFFFAGPPNPNSLPLYTRTPLNSSEYNWSNATEITNLFDEIKGVGANVIKLSWWGTNNEYQSYAPTFNSVDINKTVFSEAQKRNLLVAPLVEVSPSFKFYEEFPADTTNLETRIKSLIADYGSQQNWLTIYDKNLQPRKVIWLIESIHISSIDAAQFAQAFDTVANKIEQQTGQKIGFIIDPTPLPPNGPTFGPDPIALKSINSILAINPFNITSDGTTETERIARAENILKIWHLSEIPLIVPVLPGYDDHIVRPPGQIYGDNLTWRTEMTRLALTYQTAGVTLDTWNGFTEGYAFTPTTQNGRDNYNLAIKIFSSIQPYFQNEYIRIWDSRVFPGIIDLFYIDQNGNWQQYNNIVPIARVNGVWANAELDKAIITKEFISSTPQGQIVKYQFSPLSNGAHFYLLMTLTSGQKEVQFQVKLNADSAPVQALALGNYYGYAQLVRYLKINGTTYDALSYPKPDPDGNYTLGRFTRYEYPTDNRVEFWGESGLKQFQYVDVPLSQQDEMVSEVRYTPWLPQQPAPGKNWFETVHITRSPFDDTKSVWHFGYVPTIAQPTPTTIVAPTNTPIPQNTPTPTLLPTTPITLTPTPTPLSTGLLNVKTIPSLAATIKIVNNSTGNVVITSQSSINGAKLNPGQYYVTFSYPRTKGFRTPRTTKFTISIGKTTEITGNFYTGKTTITYK